MFVDAVKTRNFNKTIQFVYVKMEKVKNMFNMFTSVEFAKLANGQKEKNSDLFPVGAKLRKTG